MLRIEMRKHAIEARQDRKRFRPLWLQLHPRHEAVFFAGRANRTRRIVNTLVLDKWSLCRRTHWEG